MKTKIKSFALLIALMVGSQLSSTAQTAKSWNVDKSHASVQFSIDHFFSAVTGKFQDFNGEITFDPSDLKNSKASFVIQVASIDTDDDERDGHLQSDDFFAATTHTTITFNSKSFKKVSDTEVSVTGDLTMRGVTKEITFQLMITGRMDNPWKKGSEILGVKLNTTINRTEFGVGTGSWAATAVVGDEVDVSVNMELDAVK